MNKPAIVLVLAVMSLASAFTTSFAYLASVSSLNRESTAPSPASATLTPSPSSATPDNQNSPPSLSSPQSTTPSPSPTRTEAPKQTTLDDASYPEGLAEWLPLGVFGIVSPTNGTYTSNTLTLKVGGTIIAGNPYLSFSLDGGPRTPVPIEVKKVAESMMQRSISGSVALLTLSDGAHTLVLFADLGLDSRKGKETIYFDVEAG